MEIFVDSTKHFSGCRDKIVPAGDFQNLEEVQSSKGVCTHCCTYCCFPQYGVEEIGLSKKFSGKWRYLRANSSYSLDGKSFFKRVFAF